MQVYFPPGAERAHLQQKHSSITATGRVCFKERTAATGSSGKSEGTQLTLTYLDRGRSAAVKAAPPKNRHRILLKYITTTQR